MSGILHQSFVAAERIVLDYVNGPEQKTVAGLAARRKEFGEAVKTLTAKAHG
jgi:hypothetical protein